MTHLIEILTAIVENKVLDDALQKSLAAAVAEFKAGKQKAVGALVGAVMKETGGKANPKVVNEILQKKLQG